MSKGQVARGPDGAASVPTEAVGQANLPAVVTPEPGTIRSERPGPPKPLTENILAKAQPDAIDTNERAWSLKKSKLREGAMKAAEDFAKDAPKAQPLFGARVDDEPAPAEGEEPAEETPAEGEEQTEEQQKEAAELKQIATRDRENRRLRKELKRIEASAGTAKQKEAKFKELAKTNPRGVAAYFGITDEAILTAIRDHGDKPPEAVKVEEEEKPQTNESEEKLRKENARLQFQIAMRDTITNTTAKVQADGGSRWPAVAAMGPEAIQEAVNNAMEMMKGAKRAPTNKEGHEILEHWLDVANKKYAAIGAKVAGSNGKAKAKPTPRNPQPGPRTNPMDKRGERDPADPRNKPTWREIGDAHRRKLFGG